MSASSEARSASGSAATRLQDDTSSWNSSTVISGVVGNVADSSGSNRSVSSNTSRHRPEPGRFAGREAGCDDASSRSDTSWFQPLCCQRACGYRIARPPPGRSTRWISASAAVPSNQWNAEPTNTASTAPSASGIASAVPSSASAAGTWRTRIARISASGSTAIRRPTRGASTVDSLPVPAARSSTVASPSSPNRSSAHSIGAGSVGRRARS